MHLPPQTNAPMSLLFRFAAILQIAGGFYGLFQFLPVLFIGRASLIVVIGILLSGLALVAGVLLLENHASGERLSRIVQFLQIPLLAIPGFSYSWHVGAALPLTARLSPSFATDIDWWLPSQALRLGIGQNSSVLIGVNLLALILWLALWSRR